MDARPGAEPLKRQSVDTRRDPQRLRRHARRRDPRPRGQDRRRRRCRSCPGDAALLTGVFGNLLSNALQYGPRSGGEIHVSAERSEAGWTFSVDSPGPAIPERDRQRIFEPWQRGWGERRSRGVGLGLAIVRQVVERHGGQVGVTSPSRPRQPVLLHAAGVAGRRAGLRPEASPRMRCAAATASSRERASSLRRMFFTCERTVSLESTSWSAIWSVVLLSASRSTTSHSRGVSGDLIGRSPPPPPGRAAQLLDQPHAEPARDRGLAVEHALERPRQDLDVDVLGEEARGAGAQARAARSRRRRPS